MVCKIDGIKTSHATPERRASVSLTDSAANTLPIDNSIAKIAIGTSAKVNGKLIHRSRSHSLSSSSSRSSTASSTASSTSNSLDINCAHMLKRFTQSSSVDNVHNLRLLGSVFDAAKAPPDAQQQHELSADATISPATTASIMFDDDFMTAEDVDDEIKELKNDEVASLEAVVKCDEAENGAKLKPRAGPSKHRHHLSISSNCSAAEVLSLSSMMSNYSQFDFVAQIEAKSEQTCVGGEKKSSGGFASFFTRFTSKKIQTVPVPAAVQITIPTPTSGNLFSGALKLFANSSSDKQKSKLMSELNAVPSSVLILENRPSNLPAKSHEEAEKHKHEYEKMIEQAKKKEAKEKQLKLKRFEQQQKKEDFMANSLRLWNTEIIPNWDKMKNDKRTQDLWWHSLPPSIRGKVWKLAIGNELQLMSDDYYFYEKKAHEKIEILSRTSNDEQLLNASLSNESGVELIKLDVSRTFPQLCFFQRDGPYHDALHSVLGAFACYNPKIGYVQGMSFLAAILLLNMEAPDAFIALSNLLNTDYLIACFKIDQVKISKYFKLHQILFSFNIPELFEHFAKENVKPDLYLIEWIFTLFSKSLPLDVTSRVWDVYFRDQEEFLFRTALGILNLYKDILLEMDFISIVKFLTKLPEDINSTQLFKSIEQVKTSIDEEMSFANLVASVVSDS